MNDQLLVSSSISLIDALKYMDSIEKKILVVCENRRFIGVLSIGDIQRAILKKVDLKDCVANNLRENIIYANIHDDLERVRTLMIKRRIECMPIVDDDNNIVDILEWPDFQMDAIKTPICCPVVIMAGGEGRRLRPLTNIIPKPLIPISNKTIIEEIMDRFVEAECHDFYLSVNYRADAIVDYFEKLNNGSDVKTEKSELLL